MDRQRATAGLDVCGGGPVQQGLQRSGLRPGRLAAADSGQSIAGGDAAADAGVKSAPLGLIHDAGAAWVNGTRMDGQNRLALASGTTG